MVSSNFGLTNFSLHPRTELFSIIPESLNHLEYYPVEEQTRGGNNLDWSLSSHNLQDFWTSVTYNDDDLANLEPSLGDFLPGNLLTTETLISNQSLAAMSDFSSHTLSNQMTSQSRGPIAFTHSKYRDNTPDPYPTPKGLHIEKLAELSVSLYKHALKFPSGLSKQSPSRTELNRSPIFETFPFDKTCLLTQDLLEVLTNVCQDQEEPTSPLPTSNPPHWQPPEGFNAIVVYHENEASQESSRSNPLPLSSLDDANTLLIMSCYACVVDIFEIISTHTEECMKMCASPASQNASL